MDRYSFTKARVRILDGGGSKQSGVVMAIGGAEDKFRERTILSTFLELAGRQHASIAIIPTASTIESAGERYKGIFLELGARSAQIAYIHDREHAGMVESCEAFHGATGIFITGGNQLRLSTKLGGTQVESTIKDCWRQGAVVAGTSAGASILSSHMVAFGISGPTPRQRMAQMVAGFGLVDRAVIDQHFRQRDRTGRLLSMLSGSPTLLGVGVDEDTAALFGPDGTIDVIGKHSVTIVDGSRMFTDYSEIRGYGDITVSGAVIHSLAPGRRFDVRKRSLVQL